MLKKSFYLVLKDIRNYVRQYMYYSSTPLASLYSLSIVFSWVDDITET
jgi:hypothetical protein